MQHRIKNVMIKNIEGKPFQVIKYDKKGEPIPIKEGDKITNYETRDGNLVDCLKLLITNLPKEIVSVTENGIKAHNLYNILDNSKEEIVVKDGLYEWVKKMLNTAKTQMRSPITGEAAVNEEGKNVFVSIGTALFGLTSVLIYFAWTGEGLEEEDDEPAKDTGK